MFSGLLVVVALVVLPFRGQASTSMIHPSPTSSQVSPSTSLMMSTPSLYDLSQASTSIMTASSTSTTVATVAPSPTSSPSTSSMMPIQPPGDLTCFRICFTINISWSQEYANKSSPRYNDIADGVKLGGLFEPHGKYVTVEKLSFTESDDNLVRVQEDICLVVDVKIGTPFLEDVFERGVENFTLKYCFEPLGVTFPEWKAKDGECESKCERAAGPFDIEAKCKPEKHSCNGLKNKSKETQDCVHYCSSSSTCSVVVTVSYLILAMAISLSVSF